MSESKSITTRFWEKVRKTPTCWEWTAATNDSGYGIFTIRKPYGWGHIFAHRFSYESYVDALPAGHIVNHTCGNHLTAGTTKWWKPGRVMLTESQVLEIRKALQRGASVLQLAKQYGASRGAIYSIKKRKSWVKLQEI